MSGGRNTVRAVAAYGAALAMTPYLLIKISWVVGVLTGLLDRDQDLSVAGFVALNTVTIVMAVAGITLALALIRPWGERIPARLVLPAAWIGCGFLVPMIPYAVLSELISDSGSDGASALPGWEYALIQASFVGMGIGLAVALPSYLRARWPAAFTGRVAGGPVVRGAAIALVGALLVGGLSLFWAAGGTVGLAHPSARETGWHLQSGNTALWSFAGAWAVAVLGRARGGVPLWSPVGLGWIVSGYLVAWGGWKLVFAVLQLAGADVGVVWPERLGVAAGLFVLMLVTGAATLTVVLRTYRARRTALPSA